LVEQGADLNLGGPLVYACEKGNEEIVKYLLERGADVNQVNNDNVTPLGKTCWNGNEALVKYLIEYGVNNDQLRDGLCQACKNSNVSLVNYFVEHGADVNYKSDEQ